RQRGSEADELRAARLDAINRPGWRKAARQDDMPDLMLGASVDQFAQLGVHRNQIYPERAIRACLGLADFRIEKLRAHRTTADHAKAAGVGDGGDEVALAHPA